MGACRAIDAAGSSRDCVRLHPPPGRPRQHPSEFGRPEPGPGRARPPPPPVAGGRRRRAARTAAGHRRCRDGPTRLQAHGSAGLCRHARRVARLRARRSRGLAGMRILFRGRVPSLAGDSNSLLVEGGTITWVGKGRPPRRPQEVVVTGPGELIAPGFIDLQVNGFGGHDAATGTDAIAAISELLPATGVTAFLPTLISAPVEIGVGFTAAAGAAAARAKGARVLGSHLEGPFINRAFLGAHELKCLADPTSEQVDVIAQARPRLVTIAPELPGGLDAIARLRAARVVVSAGHTGADFDCGRAAIAAGVRFGTHIFNAMTPVHHRRPGIALALLLDPKVTVGLISDGEHVHPAVWEQVVRAKGASHVALTTDQTAAAGLPVGSYMLSGQRGVSDWGAGRA